MRKYQQLLLLVISCISIGILLMYKTENNRLKDVLHVINFFGRNDAAILKRVENNASMLYIRDFIRPLAVWQSIGRNFHAYSSYWRRNELVAGGEAVAIVVGVKGALLNFKCALNFKGSTSSNIQGKFRFQRIDKDGEDDGSEFTRYNFYCKVTRDFGLPESVSFTEVGGTAKDGHGMKLRMVKIADEELKKLSAQPLVVCLDLYNNEFFNMTSVDRQPRELMEFFIHHYLIGIEDFLVYNSDELPASLLPILDRFNIHVHSIPFNFPFSANISSERIRSIIEMDCILRTINRSRHVLLLEANEFFYPNSKLDSENSLLRTLRHYDKEVTHFDLATFAICKDQKQKYLIENILYDPELKGSHRISLYRPLDTGISLSAEELFSSPRRISLPMSQVISHRYVNCIHVGKDGLHDWRNSMREDFMNHLLRLKGEIMLLI